MDGPTSLNLAEHTTLRVGGAADSWVIAHSDADLCDAVRRCDESGVPVLLLGGGSNLLVGDVGFRGQVIQVATLGFDLLEDEADHVVVRIAAGEGWDDVVARAVERGWTGIEALSGIPGLVGATPVQNVGAYGQDIAQTLVEVEVLDRASGEIVTLRASDCGFGYRTSRFKQETDRWVILAVTARLGTSGLGRIAYPELAGELQIAVGDEAPVQAVRDAVLALRGRKGMVLNADDHDTWSAGSFFTNPIVTREVASAMPQECPRYPADSGVKLSAAWLIAGAGINPGFGLADDARARISTRHTLALTNRGGATADDLLELARTVRARVQDAYGIELEPEPRLISCVL